MTRKSERANGGTSRRNFLAVTGVAGAAALAGCSGSSGDSKDSSTSSGGDGSDTSNDNSDKTSEQSGDMKSKDLLTAGGSSTVYPITNDAASLWNYNAPADDEEYWPHSKYNIDTKKNFADYWASQYDVSANSDKGIPFHVSVGLSHSGVGLNKVKEGKTDIGDASAPVQAELSGLDSYDKFKNHVVGIDAMQVVVSKDIKDSGVKQITIEDLAKVYRGKITNWSKLGGPDRKIQVVGRVEGSGTRTIFHENVLDGKKEAAGVQVHKGENQQVASTVGGSNNAIGYVGYAFVSDKTPALHLKVDSTVYSQEHGNLGSKDYPLNRDLHCYTYEGTDKYEAAFIGMIISEFGQKEFVKPHNYIMLPEDRRKEEKQKLKQ
ncbi:PstS family phosphate ABC transporter substrate-binding protein [Haladaptatus sp.]|uniref:PstS family phosphate ABC transporter substrate-binding protein n=1 Tax=Haladaptatus sp. TaxID=1973141 RepID=UPI003C69D046